MSFHVPEKLRVTIGRMASDSRYGNNGAFIIPPKGKRPAIHVIASDGGETPYDAWEHVSVSLPLQRCPTWEEMCFVKSIFWDAEDTVMQLHPPQSTWVNNHPHCLHLWSPVARVIPTPPGWMVGVKELNPEQVRRLVNAGALHNDLVDAAGMPNVIVSESAPLA